ncbi:MAG: glycosyltransferase, partial [Bdellovibrionales bacterium]|nr:glycosyltransferase [Bdellovibrionales bacterium]
MVSLILEHQRQRLLHKEAGELALKRKLAILDKIDFSNVKHQEDSVSPLDRLTVVIPARNLDEDRIERCLRSIRSNQDQTLTEIIVSDFGSHPGKLPALRKLCERYHARLIENKTVSRWNRARVLNIAIRNCRTPWIMFTDADMIFGSELIPMWREYRKQFGDNTMYLAQCKKLPPISDLPLHIDANAYNSLKSVGRVFSTDGHGGCQVLRTSWLIKVRGFNENYEVWGAEDNDLSYRAHLDGIATVWMQPGKLLHQWHLKSAPKEWRDKNRAKYMELLSQPALVVNDENWGSISPQEEAEYERYSWPAHTASSSHRGVE